MRGFAIPLGPSAEITTILDLGNRRLGLVVADIAGKGIGAAVLMANLQAALRSHRPAQIRYRRERTQSDIAAKHPSRLMTTGVPVD